MFIGINNTYLVIGKMIIKWEESMTNSFLSRLNAFTVVYFAEIKSFNCDFYPFLYIVNVFKYSISVLINVLIIS